MDITLYKARTIKKRSGEIEILFLQPKIVSETRHYYIVEIKGGTKSVKKGAKRPFASECRRGAVENLKEYLERYEKFRKKYMHTVKPQIEACKKYLAK